MAIQRPANGAPNPSATDCGWMVTISPRSWARRHGVRSFRLDADDARLRSPRLHGRGDAADQPAAADADDHHIDIGHVVDDLEPDAAVARDGRIERVHEREAFSVPDALHLGECVTHVLAVQDLRAVPETRLDLGANGPGEHDDGHRHTACAPAHA